MKKGMGGKGRRLSYLGLSFSVPHHPTPTPFLIQQVTSIMASKGNILKDSFYKQRLARTSNHIIKGYTTNLAVPPLEEQSDTDAVVISPEEEQVDFKQYLSDFGRTASGQTFAFREVAVTHKRLPALHRIAEFKYLERVDLSFNCLKTLKYLNGLNYLSSVRATDNQLTSILELKETPLHLDSLDLSGNRIAAIPDLSRHKALRVLKLSGNKITGIGGLDKNKVLRVLDLSENQIEQVSGLDNLGLTQLYLSNNQIQTAKGLAKLQHLRVLDLSVNRLRKLGGLVNLVALRELRLAKNNIRHIRQVDYLQNLMFLTVLDLSYNPLQQRKYYRLQVVYKLPMLRQLDGTALSGTQAVQAESLYGLDVEEKYGIFKRHLAEEEFVDRRIHKSQLIQAETDSEGENNHLVDEYDQDGRRTNSNSRSKNSRAFNASKRSHFSKNSKRSSISKP